ncbi:MAG: hypothetical protein HXX16_11145 [Bacteroidales bacterium]|nr:hypothetical protein [Bacteroidales bacterium]
MEQQRKNYQENAHKTLDDIFKGIDSLEEKLRSASKDFSENMEVNIKTMKEEAGKLNDKFREVCQSNSDSWKDVSNGFERAISTLRETLANTWKKVKE